MLSQLNLFFNEQDEPNRSCYLSLRKLVLDFDKNITEHWKYKIPFYYYKGKPFCYFWKDKKSGYPYIGIVKGKLIDHPVLVQGDRKKMKVFPVDPEQDIPIQTFEEVLGAAMKFYS